MWVVDQTGVIVAHELTDATVDDAATGVELIEAVGDDIASVTADAAYDTVAFYDAAGARGATVVVPPAKTARVSRRRPRSRARDRTITKVKSIGRRRWKKTSRYHQQARVENAFFRYKSIIGDGLRARTPGGRTVEAVVACNVLNAMTASGRSRLVRDRPVKCRQLGSWWLNFDSCNNAEHIRRTQKIRHVPSQPCQNHVIIELQRGTAGFDCSAHGPVSHNHDSCIWYVPNQQCGCLDEVERRFLWRQPHDAHDDTIVILEPELGTHVLSRTHRKLEASEVNTAANGRVEVGPSDT